MSKLKNEIKFVTLKEPGIKDFALARNKILDDSKSDWLFFVDSDEIVTEGLRNELSTLDLTGYSGFYVKRKNYFLGKFIGIDRMVRLGERGAGRWHRSVHEVWMIRGKIGELRNPIIHETAKNLNEYISKINYYSTLHAEANMAEGKRANFFKVIFYPKFKFVESVINGRGVVFSILQSFHSFLAWSKQWTFQKS